MKRIIYGAPSTNTPAGGVKVIYRHSEILRKLGISSFIWHPGNTQFKCTWFENSIDTIGTEELSPETDFMIIPEIWASSYVSMLKKLGFRVAIFVQNCYYTHVNLNSENPSAIAEAYRDADLILSISQDSSEYMANIFKVPAEKIVLQRYSIDTSLFHPNKKSKLITYMPRKMGQHSARVVSVLNTLIPKEWQIRALDSMNEREVASNLAESIIFLAFSEFEGLPVPPVEAALSGNIVIGYHGQGGREYWNEPSFISIEQGDIQHFINKTMEIIGKIEKNSLDLDMINSTMQVTRRHFDGENELEMLENLIKKIG
jgi:glycosyltransferase involved in cell wall biosynthesis